MKKKFRFRLIALIFATAISIFTLVKCRDMIFNEIEVQLFNNLKDVALQNKATMEKELNSKYELLVNIAAEIEEKYPSVTSQSDVDSLVKYLNDFVDIYDFKRMGYISINGTAYTTDNAVCDLSNEEVYIYGSQGIAHITGSLTDLIGVPDTINVFGIPLFNEDSSFNGILFATALTDQFKHMLNVDSFGGSGYSYIIKDDGTVITDSAKSPMYGTTNVFDSMLTFSDKNQKIINSLKTAMSNGESGYGSFQSSSKRYLYYTPLELDSFEQNWYLFTIVPADVLDEKVEKLLDYQDFLLIVIVGSMAFIFLCFVYSYGKDGKTLRRLAYVDPLTNGDNYSSFIKKFKTNKESSGYIISIDFSDFKLLNSICGVEKGNDILKATWDIISADLRYSELAAHIRGDQYVMFLKASTRELLLERVQEFYDKIVALAQQFNTIHLSPYFGIYEITSVEDPEASHTCAIQAKNYAKSISRNKCWAFYSDINIEEIEQSKQIENAFEDAIANREFEVWYQPKYTADTNVICGAEALVRWRKKDGTLVPPYKFIPLLEKNGKIITLDEYVFASVCRQIRNWELEGKPLFPISINVSRASLYFDHIVERYVKILQKYHIKTEYVPIEITESATINNTQIQDLVNKFRNAGFPIYLDDFGNGYSSLATLNIMQFDTLKLDKSLVDFVGDSKGEKLLSYVIMLAKSLGMHITAEGVETLSQVNFLNSLHCDELQGYYFSKPLPCSEFEQLF